jgi:DNA helicase-2/ATP-dependent DNA helicase PcrA
MARTGLQSTLTHLATAQSSTGSRAIVEHCQSATRPLVRAHYPDGVHRVLDVDRLAETAATHRDVRAFVAELTIDPASASADYAKKPQLDEDFLTLTTVHSAKGLEWTAVHLIHAVDGAFPSDMALSSDEGLEEEQRLFYVAVTRARDSLTIYTPARMPTHPTGFGARHVMAKPSRFLTDEACALIDRRSPERRDRDSIAGHPLATRVEIPTLQELFL